MDVPIVLVAFGGLLVVLGLAGGGIKTKWIEVPVRIGNAIRIWSVIFGVLCVSGGSLLFLFERGIVLRGNGSDGTRQMEIARASGGVEVTGKVVDVFGNPREGAVVLVRGVQRYALSDSDGRYVLADVPFQGSFTLDAHFGAERHSVTFTVGDGKLPERVSVPEALVLNPVSVEARLCRYVGHDDSEGLVPLDVFTDETPRVPFDSLLPPGGGDSGASPSTGGREIWCFLRVFGPYMYELGRETVLTFEWEWNGILQENAYSQSVGVRPYGWRTRASKRVGVGDWVLRIRAAHRELARLSFEIY